jgi:hypothetical protein
MDNGPDRQRLAGTNGARRVRLEVVVPARQMDMRSWKLPELTDQARSHALNTHPDDAALCSWRGSYASHSRLGTP